MRKRVERQHRELRTGFMLFCLLLVLYNINFRQVSSFDTYASRLVPVSILTDGDLVLDEYFVGAGGELTMEDGTPIYLVIVGGQVYDAHPVVSPLLALPVYALLIWLGTPADPFTLGDVASKLAASLMIALSALFLLDALRRFVARRVAVLATIAYALGTSVWSTASQAIWSHTGAVLCWSAALWGLTSQWPMFAGAAAAAAVLARPATAPAALLLTVYVLHCSYRKAHVRPGEERVRAAWGDAGRFAVGASLIGGIGVAHNLWLFGSFSGGLSARAEAWPSATRSLGLFGTPLHEGLVGLLVSPSRGIIVFSPIVLVAVLGTIAVWRASSAEAFGGSCAHPATRYRQADAILLARYSSLALIAVLLVYSKFTMWWAGHGYGPRYLTDVMPFCGLLIAFGLERVGRAPFGSRLTADSGAEARAAPGMRWRARSALLVTLLAYSIAVQAIGAFCWPSPWTLDKNPPYEQRLWDWKNNQILACLRAGPRLDPAARRLLVTLGVPVDPSDPYSGENR